MKFITALFALTSGAAFTVATQDQGLRGNVANSESEGAVSQLRDLAEEATILEVTETAANAYCRYYEQNRGLTLLEAWQKCQAAGEDKCGGVMWKNGAYKLMQRTDVDPLANCFQASGWTAYTRRDVPKPQARLPATYCQYYEQGGGCNNGGAYFGDAWEACVEAGPEVCSGVMWNSCSGLGNINTLGKGAYKLMKPTQDLEGCFSSSHWDAYLVEDHL